MVLLLNWIGGKDKMRKNKAFTAIAMIVFAFIFIPLLIITITSFGESSTISFPINGFTVKWYYNIFNSETFTSSFALSFKVSIIATLIALIIGIPAAYALSRYSIKGKNIIKSYFLSPTVVPGIVVGYSLFQFLVIGLRIPVFQGLVLGHFLISLPYAIRVIGSSLEQFDFSVEEVAWTLGCNKVKAFFKVVLPNISSGIFASFMLAFINSFNNIPVSMFLSGAGVRTLPTAIMSYMEYYYDPTVSAVSVLLMLGTIGMMMIIEKTIGISSISK
jgi:putative spermidine/putrescine transport system permease protein